MKSKTLQTFILTTCLFSAPICATETDSNRDPLFHIERNKNANIVQYDALLQSDGTLAIKNPVTAYWVRLANEGETKELTWKQRSFAYGVKAKTDKTNNTATMTLAMDIGRSILVKQVDGDYRAVTDINATESYIEKIYIQASGQGLSTSVDYIDLFGFSLENNEKQYERIKP